MQEKTMFLGENCNVYVTVLLVMSSLKEMITKNV